MELAVSPLEGIPSLDRDTGFRVSGYGVPLVNESIHNRWRILRLSRGNLVILDVPLCLRFQCIEHRA
jgi:hypothetical protein